MELLPEQDKEKLEKIKKHIHYNLKLLKKDFPEKEEVISAYFHYFNTQKFVDTQALLQHFIAFLDMHFIDQIADQIVYHKLKGKSFSSSLYGRDRGSINMVQNFATPYKVYIKEEWKNKSGLVDTTLFDYLEESEKDVYVVHRISHKEISTLRLEGEEKLNVVFFPESMNLEEYFSLPEMLQEKKEPFIIIGKLDFGDGIFIEFKISNYKKGWGEKYHILFDTLEKHPGKPLVLPDIQTIIKKRISLGLDIYGMPQSQDLIEAFQNHSRKKIHTILFSSNNSRSRRTFHLKANATQAQKEKLGLKHISHYERFFEDTRLARPTLFLTNSGVSANDAVLTHIAKEVPLEKWKCFDFYYENIPPFMRNHTDLNENTQVFLASPSILTPGPEKNMKDFTKSLKRDIGLFLQNAKNNPDKKYYFVFDITTNLLASLDDYFPEIPENLIVVKTYSLTKHQRGDTQYFFGGIALYGNDEAYKNTIQKTLEDEGYTLTHEQIMHYPRVRKSEIQKNMENIALNRKVFKTAFTRFLNQKGLDKLMPKIVDSDYFSMVLIPFPEIVHYAEHLDIPEQKMTHIPEYLHGLITSGQKVEESIIGFEEFVVPSFISHSILPSSTTMKDTFGLTTHNICAYFSNIGLLYFGEFNQKLKNIETPRISFSIQKDTKGAYELGLKFAQMYFMWMIKVRETALEKKENK